jgi:hypothetical protein
MMLGVGLHFRTMFLAQYLGKSPNVTQKSPQVRGKRNRKKLQDPRSQRLSSQLLRRHLGRMPPCARTVE